MIVLSGLAAFCILWYQASQGGKSIIEIIFYLLCCSSAVLMFEISMKWKMLMVKWMKTETIFGGKVYRLPKTRWSLRRRLMAMTFVYLGLSFTESGLYIASQVNQLSNLMETCNRTSDDFVKLYISRHFHFIFAFLPFKYNHFLGFLFEYINFLFSFYWNFLDLFIILISLGISALCEKNYHQVKSLKKLLVSDSRWSEIRFHYAKVSELVKIINEHISKIVIVASFSDGYFFYTQAVNITTWVKIRGKCG